MGQLRKDPVVGRWVIISPERARRPSDYDYGRDYEQAQEEEKRCPFCPGHEGETPPEIVALRAPGTQPNTSGWWVRVVPNKFPFLKVEGELRRVGEGIYDKMSGVGAHEIIIETPAHEESFYTLPRDKIADIVRIYRERFLDLKKDIRLHYIIVIKNHGKRAGGVLDHPHSHLIATPISTKRIIEEIEGARTYYDYRERCVYCDIIEQEMSSTDRVVMETNFFISLEPFAPRFPFETWIIPKRHSPFFEQIRDEEIRGLAVVLKQTLQRLAAALNAPPYNLILHSSPFKLSTGEYFHWHLEIIPKLVRLGGFEWGSGLFINHTPPEEAARYLKEVEIEEG